MSRISIKSVTSLKKALLLSRMTRNANLPASKNGNRISVETFDNDDKDLGSDRSTPNFQIYEV
jgi:hypothetical protein